MAHYELYRKSAIGATLTEALDEMVEDGSIPPQLALQVMLQFDKSMNEALNTQVKSKCVIKGHLHTYRFCDNVWTWILEDATFKIDNNIHSVPTVKIVACDAKMLPAG
eukprot:jgi/Mesvir1/24672/Mv21966-RA.1